jgi:hypothetical protein
MTEDQWRLWPHRVRFIPPKYLLFCLQGAKKLCPQCNMITSPSDLRRIYMWRQEEMGWSLDLKWTERVAPAPLPAVIAWIQLLSKQHIARWGITVTRPSFSLPIMTKFFLGSHSGEMSSPLPSSQVRFSAARGCEVLRLCTPPHMVLWQVVILCCFVYTSSI